VGGVNGVYSNGGGLGGDDGVYSDGKGLGSGGDEDGCESVSHDGSTYFFIIFKLKNVCASAERCVAGVYSDDKGLGSGGDEEDEDVVASIMS